MSMRKQLLKEKPKRGHDYLQNLKLAWVWRNKTEIDAYIIGQETELCDKIKKFDTEQQEEIFRMLLDKHKQKNSEPNKCLILLSKVIDSIVIKDFFANFKQSDNKKWVKISDHLKKELISRGADIPSNLSNNGMLTSENNFTQNKRQKIQTIATSEQQPQNHTNLPHSERELDLARNETVTCESNTKAQPVMTEVVPPNQVSFAPVYLFNGTLFFGSFLNTQQLPPPSSEPQQTEKDQQTNDVDECAAENEFLKSVLN